MITYKNFKQSLVFILDLRKTSLVIANNILIYLCLRNKCLYLLYNKTETKILIKKLILKIFFFFLTFCYEICLTYS